MNEHQPSPTISSAEAAEILGLTPGHFSRRKKHLIANDAMPAPLPGGRYSRAAFMRWVEDYGAAKARQTRESLASLRVRIDRERLEALYARAAA